MLSLILIGSVHYQKTILLKTSRFSYVW